MKAEHARRNNLIFTVLLLAAAALLFWALHGGTGGVAVLQYGDDAQELRIPLSKDADYTVDTGYLTVRLHVEDGGIAFVDSPCPDHLCEHFGVLRESGDWAACLPAKASLTVE